MNYEGYDSPILLHTQQENITLELGAGRVTHIGWLTYICSVWGFFFCPCCCERRDRRSPVDTAVEDACRAQSCSMLGQN